MEEQFGRGPNFYADPVAYDYDKRSYGFWNESWSIFYDGFTSEAAARTALATYCAWLESPPTSWVDGAPTYGAQL